MNAKLTNQNGKINNSIITFRVFIATIIALLSLPADCLFYIIDQAITLTKKPNLLIKYIIYY